MQWNQCLIKKNTETAQLTGLLYATPQDIKGEASPSIYADWVNGG